MNGTAAVAVKFNLVELFLTLRQALNQPDTHRLDETDFGGSNLFR